MSTPRFYYYPDPSGSLEALDLGEEVTTIQETPLMQAEDAYGGDGKFFRSVLLTGYRVRITLERFGQPGTSSLERDLMTMQSHLQRGGLVGFSRDHAKTWGTLAASPCMRGDTILYHSGQGFAPWSPSAALAADDELIVEDTAGQRDYTYLLGAPNTNALPLASGLKHSYGSTTPLLRWRDFYPVLYLPSSQLGRSFMSHDGRRTWTMDLTLEYGLGDAIALWGQDAVANLELQVGLRSSPGLRDAANASATLGRGLSSSWAAQDPRAQVKFP